MKSKKIALISLVIGGLLLSACSNDSTSSDKKTENNTTHKVEKPVKTKIEDNSTAYVDYQKLAKSNKVKIKDTVSNKEILSVILDKKIKNFSKGASLDSVLSSLKGIDNYTKSLEKSKNKEQIRTISYFVEHNKYDATLVFLFDDASKLQSIYYDYPTLKNPESIKDFLRHFDTKYQSSNDAVLDTASKKVGTLKVVELEDDKGVTHKFDVGSMGNSNGENHYYVTEFVLD